MPSAEHLAGRLREVAPGRLGGFIEGRLGRTMRIRLPVAVMKDFACP
jgi:hypothetical protein